MSQLGEPVTQKQKEMYRLRLDSNQIESSARIADLLDLNAGEKVTSSGIMYGQICGRLIYDSL